MSTDLDAGVCLCSSSRAALSFVLLFFSPLAADSQHFAGRSEGASGPAHLSRFIDERIRSRGNRGMGHR